MSHSLQPAVDAGVITAEAAFCGLSPSDVQNLFHSGYAGAQVVIRFRGPSGEGRRRATVADLAQDRADYDGLNSSDIRDVMAASVR